MTITPTAPTIPGTSEGAHTSPGSAEPTAARRRGRAVLLGLTVLGLVLAAATVVWAGSDEPVLTPASPVSADGTDRWLSSLDTPARPTSADGAERRASAEQDALHTRCAGSSADAVERCVTSG